MTKLDLIKEQREQLPTFEYKQELVDAIREYNILVIIGETGSGKTTQIPQYILEEMPEVKKIGVTQPRRIAAITVAKRVSEEQDVRLGSNVGYTIRFDDHTSPDTKLKYMTDGILLREATIDPSLSQYSVIVIDEAHERTLETDVLFGLLKETQRIRSDLKILVMSATLDVTKFSDFFGECPIFEIPGRTYPVELSYPIDAPNLSTLKSSFVDRAVETAWDIHRKEPPGDLLVFLTGQQDIERACKAFTEKLRNFDHKRNVRFYEDGQGVIGADIYPLHASLETLDQKAVFQLPKNQHRKIVFATNVAQTSVTIPGIKYVVDCGFAKEKSYDPNTGMDALLVTEISQAAAIQRAGRAGKAYRLYSEESFNRMIPNTIPEIQKSSLLSTVLAMKKMNIVDVLNFQFIDPPDEALVRKALKHLYLLGAIDEEGKLSKLGDKMSYFPLSPSLARVLIASAEEYKCSYEAVIIASILSSEHDLFKQVSPRSREGEEGVARAEQSKQRLSHHTGDHMTLLNVWNEWKYHDKSRSWCKENYINHKVLEAAVSVRSQLMDVMSHLRLDITKSGLVKRKTKSGKSNRRVGEIDRGMAIDPVPIIKSFLMGYFTNVANKSPHRPVFSHHTIEDHLTNDASSNISSMMMVALHLHPLCALSDMADRDKTQYSDIDWVFYTNVTYTNKAVMKGVSKIVWDWVKNGEGQERIKKLPKTRLNGEAQPNVEDLENEYEQIKAEKEEEQQEQIKQMEAEEKKKRRAEEIDLARQRALARRRV
ncbi:ATP-dependent RNA helicase dhx8 [Rhizopus stolonifer]|uniref:RNA helicase n=1 Tax=Rhizopus stolonifer TaxID=4846 RepID=A0A367KYQ8_RHIST|nr:ATP-dependent RNA helicase dhx8 [Rhizopus stolonifer]